MPQYRLTYFKGTGTAETTRMLLHMAGQEFEDVRLAQEQWQALKPSTPMGQLPLLEVDGKVLCQSKAMARYISNKYGFAGKDEWEKAEVDMIVDCLEDAIRPLYKAFYAQGDEEKARLKKDYQENIAPGMFAKIEALLVKNNGGSGWFVGDSITTADIAFLNVIQGIDNFGIKVDRSPFPKLAALEQRVVANPKIADWIKKRPN